MMKLSSLILAAVFSLALLVGPAYAGNPCATNPCAPKDDYMARHHKMKKEHLGMLKELMIIVRDLNHKPTEAEKQKLDEMIKKLDVMVEQCDKAGWKKKGGKGKGGM